MTAGCSKIRKLLEYVYGNRLSKSVFFRRFLCFGKKGDDLRRKAGWNGDFMDFEKEQLQLNIFDNSPVPYCITEPLVNAEGKPVDWIYRYCNQAFADIKDYRLDAMIGQSSLNLFPQTDEKWAQAYYRAAYENRSCEIELVIGEKVYRATVMPLGRRGLCSCMLYEIGNETGKSPKQEQDENKRYILNKLSPEYVSIYRIELNSGKYEILRLADNTNAKKLVGKNERVYDTYDEYAKEYAENFILEEDKKEFLDWLSCKNLKKRLRREDKITYHYHSVSKQGAHSFFEAYAVKGQIDDKHFHIFLAFRNIDSILYKEKAIQKQLQEALDEARLSNEIISAIAKTYQYISRIDIRADRFEEIANKDKENLNFIKEGILSENNKKVCRQYVAEEYQEAFFKFTDLTTLPERMKDEETIVLEYRMKDGNWHRLRFIEKKRDENGELTHVLCVIRSIGDAKRREQALLYQVEEAKKEVALKSRFLSNMSHDIRTPMNGIMGMLDLANRYPDDLEVQKKCRDQIAVSSHYLISIVNDILDMNKLESGEIDNREIPFDLTDLLNRANTEKQKLAAEKQVEYVVDWERADIRHVHLIGNPVYVERMLTIVCDNAVKFTGSGGSVHVWCAEKTSDAHRVVYEFGCQDTGIGMSEEFVAHAFDLFAQENETSRSKYEGTGLGLALAKKLAECLNGTIEIQSKKGEGTTVIMTVPFKIGEAEGADKHVNYEDISIQGLRALVVEDNELNMEIAKFMLEENGVSVECAMDGVEAVERFETSEPGYYDAIFMDIMMPNQNGWDATRSIRSMKRLDAGNIPIIAMSANAFAEDIINSRISGMNVHLTKPLEESKLLGALRECIGKRLDVF